MNKKVLILADDEPMLHEVIPLFVEVAFPDFQLEILKTPAEEVARLQKAQIANESLVVIMQDIESPEGEFPYHEAILLPGVLSVVMISSKTEDCMIGGKVFKLVKPFGLKKFAEVVNQAIEYAQCMLDSNSL